jgi:hypothetical protein
LQRTHRQSLRSFLFAAELDIVRRQETISVTQLKPWTPGNVLAIQLESGRYAYGRVIELPLVAFYDLSSALCLPVTQVVAARIAFQVWVMKYAVGNKHWRVIGNVPLEPHLLEQPTFFKQDPINGKLSLYRQNVERPASLEECIGLERAAAWDPEHIESRLSDHFAGIPNKWVESLRLRPPGA